MAAQVLTIQYGADPQKTKNFGSPQDAALEWKRKQLNEKITADNVSRVAAGQAPKPLYGTITEWFADLLNDLGPTTKAELRDARLAVISPAVDNASTAQLTQIASTLGVTLP